MSTQYIAPPIDQLLNKLDWLTGRSVTDFKGHAPRPERKLKLADVASLKEAAERKMVGGVFVPFTRGKNASKADVPYHASRLGVVRREDNKENIRFAPQVDRNHPNHNNYKQRLDPTTGRPELATVLTYNEEWLPQAKTTGKRTVCRPQSSDIFGTSPATVGARPLNDHVAEVDANSRCAVLRDDLMRHPMFTKESKIAHATVHWDPMSQLLAHQYIEPPKKDLPRAKSKKNPVRMTGLSRSMPPATRAWH